MATGGRGVGRDRDGRVVFVDGALPGETVVVEVGKESARFAEADLVEVLAANPARREPPCPAVARGCGGCDLSHAEPALQRELKAAVVADCLARIAGLTTLPVVDPGPLLATVGFRTTVRAAVDRRGRAGLRARNRHHPVISSECRVAHPLVEELLVEGRYRGADEVTIRVGARTGERMVVVDGDRVEVDVPDDVTVVGARRPGAASYHEVVQGVRFTVSARSFFQSRPDGADALVDVVRAAFGPHGEVGRLVDACAGVGLFGATIPAGSVVAVESSRAAAGDAAANLPPGSLVARCDLARWHHCPADAVVADPSREGLGRRGVDKITATEAPLVVLVSCDPGSMGRDAGLLVSAGYELTDVTLVDLFPDTHHVETVTVFRR